MQKLSTELGIPVDQFYISMKRIETNLSNKDSLVKIANELYVSTDKYLKENERESSAALIILGGWTEALYIGTKPLKTNPAAELHEDPLLTKLVDARLHSVREGTDLAESRSRSDALDLRGTVFQLRVWEALRTFPRGETRTYSQLAREMGQPRQRAQWLGPAR